MAGDDSMASPTLYAQRRESVEGSAAAATPVSRALPRNWVQSAADGACAEPTATKSEKSATTEDTEANGGHGLVLYNKEPRPRLTCFSSVNSVVELCNKEP